MDPATARVDVTVDTPHRTWLVRSQVVAVGERSATALLTRTATLFWPAPVRAVVAGVSEIPAASVRSANLDTAFAAPVPDAAARSVATLTTPAALAPVDWGNDWSVDSTLTALRP
jgi:hypothetical protein